MVKQLTQSETQKIPKLRFVGFSGGWEEKRLGELGNFLGGGTPSKKMSKYWNGDVAWVSSSDISEKDFIPDVTRFITKEAIEKSATKIIPKNSLLIVSRVGVGKFAISNIDLCTSQDFTNFLPNKNIDIIFSAFLLKSKTKKLLSFNQGTSIKGFTKSDLENMKIRLPQTEEQQKIAEFLGSVDEWIENLRGQKENLEDYKKGMMQKIFSQKIRFKNKDGKNFPNPSSTKVTAGNWEEKKLGEVLKIGSGKDYKHLRPGNIPVFGTGGYMLSVDKSIYNGETVFIGRKGTIDKPFYYNGKFWTVDTLFYTHSFRGVIPKFVSFVFQQVNWKKYNEASGVPSLSKITIEKIKVNIPPIPEQQKIADFLTSLDKVIESKQQQITQAEQWKKGLMQGLFV